MRNGLVKAIRYIHDCKGFNNMKFCELFFWYCVLGSCDFTIFHSRRNALVLQSYTVVFIILKRFIEPF